MDTSLVVAALRSRLSASNQLLRRVADRKEVLLVSPALLLEYEEVLKLPEHRVWHGLSELMVDVFLSELAALAKPVEIHFRWRPQASDPRDEMVLEAAINGSADALITFNIRDFAMADKFHIRILRPGEFLRSART